LFKRAKVILLLFLLDFFKQCIAAEVLMWLHYWILFSCSSIQCTVNLYSITHMLQIILNSDHAILWFSWMVRLPFKGIDHLKKQHTHTHAPLFFLLCLVKYIEHFQQPFIHTAIFNSSFLYELLFVWSR
jgi:hypothetical protein